MISFGQPLGAAKLFQTRAFLLLTFACTLTVGCSKNRSSAGSAKH